MKENKKKKNQGSENEVGHSNPPKHSQFPKGKSGNPRGRPKKRNVPSLFRQLDPAAALVLEQAARELTVRTANGDKRISQLEAALEKLFKKGMEGDYRSLVTYIPLVKNAQDEKKEMEAKLFKAVRLHDELYAEQFKTAERESKPVPRVLPHPKDIIIDLSDPDNPVRIVGPITWIEQEELDKNLEERDSTDEMLKSLRVLVDSGETHLNEIVSKIEEGRARLNASFPPRLHKPPP